jgi:heme exporter protein B
MIYNTGLMLVLTLCAALAYMVIMGNPVADTPMFALTLVLASIGFSATLTLVSSIASKASNNGTLMPLLSFPLSLPLLVVVIRLSKAAIDGLDRSTMIGELLTLGALDLIAISLSLLLFPFLWRS